MQRTDELPQCHVCGERSDSFGVHVVLAKYNVRYYRCPFCGFIQTETPFWMEEAYASAITSSDIGYVDRNVTTARLTQAVINSFLLIPMADSLILGRATASSSG